MKDNKNIDLEIISVQTVLKNVYYYNNASIIVNQDMIQLFQIRPVMPWCIIAQSLVDYIYYEQ